jgi:hypothetical protein
MLLAAAAPVEAKGVAWCQVNGAKYQAYLSDIVEIDDGPQAFHNLVSGPFGQGFQDYVRASLDPKASGLDCTRQESLFYAQDYIDVLIKANPGFRFVKTGWHPARLTATSTSLPKPSPSRYRK